MLSPTRCETHRELAAVRAAARTGVARGGRLALRPPPCALPLRRLRRLDLSHVRLHLFCLTPVDGTILRPAPRRRAATAFRVAGGGGGRAALVLRRGRWHRRRLRLLLRFALCRAFAAACRLCARWWLLGRLLGLAERGERVRGDEAQRRLKWILGKLTVCRHECPEWAGDVVLLTRKKRFLPSSLAVLHLPTYSGWGPCPLQKRWSASARADQRGCCGRHDSCGAGGRGTTSRTRHGAQVGTLSSSHPSSVFSVFFLSFLLPLHDPVDKKSRSNVLSSDLWSSVRSLYSPRVTSTLDLASYLDARVRFFSFIFLSLARQGCGSDWHTLPRCS